MQIQWYPGHMTKTKREVSACLPLVDMVIEIVDARIPISSRNPDIDALTSGKPRLIILNRFDLADAAVTRQWGEHFRACGYSVVEADSKSGAGLKNLKDLCLALLAPALAQKREKGQVGRTVKAMVLGIPNVGKSTFINKISGRKAAKAENRPGVTRGRQWVRCDAGLEFLDTPGMLWPRFENQMTGQHLAFTGAVKDSILDLESLGLYLIARLCGMYRSNLEQRYAISIDEGMEPLAVYDAICKSRGFIVKGGEPDYERCAKTLLEEFRNGKLGRITLERPCDIADFEVKDSV